MKQNDDQTTETIPWRLEACLQAKSRGSGWMRGMPGLLGLNQLTSQVS